MSKEGAPEGCSTWHYSVTFVPLPPVSLTQLYLAIHLCQWEFSSIHDSDYIVNVVNYSYVERGVAMQILSSKIPYTKHVYFLTNKSK